MLHPEDTARTCHVSDCLTDTKGPIVAATDYVRTYPNQIRFCIDRPYYVLGTDGFGRSDTRKNLRKFFEVNRYYITLMALKSLADEGTIPTSKVSEAITKYNLDINKPNPITV
jgi:pyruvate dehydrogenase E1 component